MESKLVDVIVVRAGDPDGGGLLDQGKPPAWKDAQPGHNITVKGHDYQVIDVKGSTEYGPATIYVKARN